MPELGKLFRPRSLGTFPIYHPSDRPVKFFNAHTAILIMKK